MCYGFGLFPHPEQQWNDFRQVLTGLPAISIKDIGVTLRMDYYGAQKLVTVLPSSSTSNERRLYLYMVEWSDGSITKVNPLEIKTLTSNAHWS